MSGTMRIQAFCAYLVVAGAASVVFPPACTVKEPQKSTYFERQIAPLLTSGCVRANTGAGCHVADGRGNAFGNLDMSSFEGIDRRRDLLATYGPYGRAALLAKTVPPFLVNVESYDGTSVTVTTDIRHAGGSILDPSGSGYFTLRRWIDNGATVNNSGPPPLPVSSAPCVASYPDATGFDPTRDPETPDFAAFRDRANPVLRASCAAQNCHGADGNELHLACGDTPEQMRWNYFAASQTLGQVAEKSELVRRPLAPAQGGAFHEGGVVFATAADPGYVALSEWATAHGPATSAPPTPGFDFFMHKVQPVLVKKGCMLLHCHSGSIFHDYRLRGGSGGSFSYGATKRNYDLSVAQLSFDSSDVRASRLVRKNLYRPETREGAIGIAHRGGPVFEDFGADLAGGAACDKLALDYDNGNVDAMPGFCVVREWHKRERAARKLSPLSAIVYVKRAIPPGRDGLQDFDVYAPGSELRLVVASLSAAGAITLGADTSLNAGCGLDKATVDIKRPAVSWDGTKIAFAARSSAAEPLRIYEANADGTKCAPHGDINAGPPSDNGLLIHNFDPAYSPPDGPRGVHLVFASTRGNLDSAPYDYSGPQRTPADPAKPNANLYVYEADPNAPGANRIRQLTFLLNMERAPSFMGDGRVMLTTEKRAPGFYQLALRRVNLDGGDYHPLFGQRATFGYHEVSQVVSLSDKNFAAILADPGVPHRGGVLGVFNRSIGIDFTSDRREDYLVDPSPLDPASPAARDPSFFLHALRIPDRDVTGHPGQPTAGLYTSPFAIPEGKLLVSYGAAADPATFGGDYDLYVMDPVTGDKTRLLGDTGTAEIEAVAVVGRAAAAVYRSAPSEPNAYAMEERSPDADVMIHDMPIVASLLFQNTPTGRPIETFGEFSLYEDLPPPPGMTTLAPGPFVAADAFGLVYVRRRLLGKVPVAADGSAHYRVPGGLPLVIRLPETPMSSARHIPRTQLEEIMFSPGEKVHETFPRPFFNAFCAHCHGAISGRAVDVAMRPDLLSSASSSIMHDPGAVPADLRKAPALRGPVEGP